MHSIITQSTPKQGHSMVGHIPADHIDVRCTCEDGNMETDPLGSHLIPGGGRDYTHHILISPQSFESHKHACMFTTCTQIMLIQASPMHGTPIGHALLKYIIGNLIYYGPTFSKGGHKQQTAYHVRARRFISTRN